VSVHLRDGSVIEGVLKDIRGVVTLSDINGHDEIGSTLLRIETNGVERLINIAEVVAVAAR
jgi:hypothetical protein